jgi:hypothetical protein
MSSPAFSVTSGTPLKSRQVELSDEQRRRIAHSERALAKRKHAHAAAEAAHVAGDEASVPNDGGLSCEEQPRPPRKIKVLCWSDHHTIHVGYASPAMQKGNSDVAASGEREQEPTSLSRETKASALPQAVISTVAESIRTEGTLPPMGPPAVARSMKGAGKELSLQPTRRTVGIFGGMDAQHGPSHSDHMEEKMR